MKINFNDVLDFIVAALLIALVGFVFLKCRNTVNINLNPTLNNKTDTITKYKPR